MNKPKVVFTDSGLGGLTVMADFVSLVKKHNISVDTIFFNAQYSRELGYKKMNSKTQIEIFNRVLESIQKKYQPDIIAIACNTLSVVYYQTDFYKNNTTTLVLDIITVGKSLIQNSKTNTIIEVAMPTTISSKIYKNESKNSIAISSDIMLPDAIENGYDDRITSMLGVVFNKVKVEFIENIFRNSSTSLFLGCTHFPIIKEQFLKVARKKGIKIDDILDPNQAFSRLVFKTLVKLNKTFINKESSVQVISRMPFQKEEVDTIAKLVEKQSSETAKGLRNSILDKNLF